MSGEDSVSIVTRGQIVDGLRGLGLPDGAVVLMHSSLKSLGWVEGGAELVVAAVLEAVGPHGTLVVPTLTFGAFGSAGRRFDARTQPSETGRVTEAVRRDLRARRSLHPLSSAAAIGALSEAITTGHDDTPCGPGSPYWQVWERGGWTLFVGVDFGCNSLFHVAEEQVAPAYLSYDTEASVEVTDLDGCTRTSNYRRYACARLGIRRRLAKMGSLYAEAGVVRTATIGGASVSLLSARDNVAVAAQMLQRHPEWILTP